MRRGARASSTTATCPTSSRASPGLASTSCGPSSRCRRRSPAPTPAKRITSASAEEKAKLDAANSSGGTQRQERARVEGMHRTPSIDYAVLLAGERHLVLEESDVLLHKGDVVIQLGNWHTWENRSGVPTLMSYVMIGGEFAE